MDENEKGANVDHQAVIRLASLLCPSEASLSDEVLLAAEKPEEYFEKFEDELDQRDITEPKDLSFWLTLVDGLERRECLWTVDWKDQASNLAWGLERLSSKSELNLDWSKLAALGDDYRSTTEYADLIGATLKPAGFVLMWLDTDSDSYPLCIVKSSEAEEIKLLARRLSHRIEIFSKNS